MRSNIFKKIKLFIYNFKNNTTICSLKASLKAHYDENVCISENVVITDDVSIGAYSYVNRSSSIENCSIGRYCSISSGVWICPFEHELHSVSTHPKAACLKETEKRKCVTIGSDVLISLNAIVLSGVHIGDGAVVAAGAVVTKDVQPFEIVGGVPAKHIGWRFDNETREYLVQTKWWERTIADFSSDPMICDLEKRINEWNT